MSPNVTGIIKSKKIEIVNPEQISTKKLFNIVNKHKKKCAARNIYNRFSNVSSRGINKRQNPSKSDLRKAIVLRNKSPDDIRKLNYVES